MHFKVRARSLGLVLEYLDSDILQDRVATSDIVLVVGRWLVGLAGDGGGVAAAAATAASWACPRSWRQGRAILRYSSILYRSKSEASALSFVVIQKDFLVWYVITITDSIALIIMSFGWFLISNWYYCFTYKWMHFIILIGAFFFFWLSCADKFFCNIHVGGCDTDLEGMVITLYVFLWEIKISLSRSITDDNKTRKIDTTLFLIDLLI